MAAAIAVTLDRTAHRPLGVQLADHVREQIADGRLAAGDRLPSSRALATELEVARSVTEQAYAQLVAEGWLHGRHGSGTFVSPVAPRSRRPPPRRPRKGAHRPLVRLDTGTPWIDPRHRATWRRAWRDVAAAPPYGDYPDSRGLPELRAEIAARLARTRGVDCDPDDVRITAGTTDGLRHLLSVLPPGAVTVEDPGYRAAAETVRLADREVVDVPAPELPDAELLAGCAAAYVTPAHQHPTGRTMSGGDRVDLLSAATRRGTLVIEDDYDSEFRYDVAPVPALASLDREQVAYLGTASKAVDPGLRLGWLVAPPELTERIDAIRDVTHDSAAWPVQRAFWCLLREGYVDKAIRSARRVYADRAARVVAALEGVGAPVGPVAGMYVTIETTAATARRAHAEARRAGYDVPLLLDYCRTTRRHGLIIGFGGCTDAQLEEALTALVRGAMMAT